MNLDEKLFTVHRKEHKGSHIRLDHRLCGECSRRICLSVCPAGVYVWNEAKKQVVIRHENCLECGACRVACEMDNIEWSNPAEGTGISYRNS